MGYLKCIVTDGMFPDERSVKLKDKNGKLFSFFVTKEKIKNGHLEVGIIDKEIAIVYLPKETIEEGNRQIHVLPEALTFNV